MTTDIRVDQLEQTMKDVVGELQALAQQDIQQRMGRTEQALQGMEQVLQGMTQQELTQIKGVIEGMVKSDLPALARETTAQRDALSGVKGEYDQLLKATGDTFEEMRGKVGEQMGNIEGIKQEAVNLTQALKGEFQGLQMQMGIHMQQLGKADERIATLERKGTTSSGTTGEPRSGGGNPKPILDHKIWESLRSLTSERKGFRTWRIRFKGIMGQVTKTTLWEEMMTVVEDPERLVKSGTTAEELREAWEDWCDDNDKATEKGQWDIFSKEMTNVLMGKAEDGSEAYHFTVRSKNGIRAWAWIYNWYTATSGMGLSQRTAMVMQPTQCKKDEDVIGRIEMWMDELAEITELGGEELAWGYKTAAMKMIASDGIREEIDKIETRRQGIDPEKVFKEVRDLTLNMSKSKLINKRDNEKKKDPNSMDMGTLKEGIDMGGQGQGEEGGMWNKVQEMCINIMKGKGKGYKGSKGKGKGKGWQNWGSTYGPAKGGEKGKGGNAKGKGYGDGKGYGSTQKGTIFYGNCKGCGKVGHTMKNCPAQGKGFKGNCWHCGVQGHRGDQCPKQFPSGKGSINEVDGGKEEQQESGMNLGGKEEDANVGSEEKPINCAENWNNEDPYWGWEPECYLLDQDSEENPEKQGCCNSGWKDMCKNKHGRTVKTERPMNSLEDKKGEWERIDAIVDSGAIDIVGGKKQVTGTIRQTAASKAGKRWIAANGGAIQNEGEGDIKGQSAEGIPVNLTAQVGDKINKLLLSVGKMAAAGNAVMFNVDKKTLALLAGKDKIEPNMIVVKATGKTSKINQRDGGLYEYPIWVKKQGTSPPPEKGLFQRPAKK